ncbi:hypothetical protein C8Q75DRAFT_45640 [Abortiporus biennis]|nr:hypothetical protein C8Q75DRAFT_45640 [Abortiporus biennis]
MLVLLEADPLCSQPTREGQVVLTMKPSTCHPNHETSGLSMVYAVLNVGSQYANSLSLRLDHLVSCVLRIWYLEENLDVGDQYSTVGPNRQQNNSAPTSLKHSLYPLQEVSSLMPFYNIPSIRKNNPVLVKCDFVMNAYFNGNMACSLKAGEMTPLKDLSIIQDEYGKPWELRMTPSSGTFQGFTVHYSKKSDGSIVLRHHQGVGESSHHEYRDLKGIDNPPCLGFHISNQTLHCKSCNGCKGGVRFRNAP